MSTINYSKWDHIEVSDDEDDTHPNIDTPSLFKWRHEARVEREATMRDEEAALKAEREIIVAELKKQRDLLDKTKDNEELHGKLSGEILKLEKREAEWLKKWNEFEDKKKKQPKTIDTLCKEGGVSRTVINKSAPIKKDKSDDEKLDDQRTFVDKYEGDVKKYALFRKIKDTEEFVITHMHVICEEAANYLVLYCLELEMSEKNELMRHVAHQAICLQFILELAVSMKKDPRDCARPFFRKLENPEPEYKAGFDNELVAFIDRVEKRAQVKLKEERIALSPGGVDPQDVFEELPEQLQKCFIERDIPMLKEAMGELDEEKAKYYLKRCIESGLWVPGEAAANGDGAEEKEGEAEAGDGDGAEEDGEKKVKEDEPEAAAANEVSAEQTAE